MTQNGSSSPQITVIVPTLNRSDFVIRYLRYLKEVNFKECILIGDSSEAKHLEPTRKFIQQLDAPFQMVYKETPGVDHVRVIRDLLSKVTTPYVIWVGDDDLLVPRTLAACVEFLEHHPTYSAAGGVGVLFALASKGVYGKFAWTEAIPLRSIEADRAGERLRDLFKTFVVVGYAVSRTEQFRKRWVAPAEFSHKALAAEILPCSLTVAQGKFKQLDRLLVVRQVLHQRYLLPNLLTDRATPEGRLSCEIYRDLVAQEIAWQDGVTVSQAREIVGEAFYGWLDETLPRIAKARKVKRIRRRVAALPLVRKMWHAMRPVLPDRGSQASLQALLCPSCRYHDDFMPVYQTVTSSAD